jgi:hypothetical protein
MLVSLAVIVLRFVQYAGVAVLFGAPLFSFATRNWKPRHGSGGSRGWRRWP